MDGRARLAAGGFIAGGATIAAVAAVVMTHSAALVDTAGVALAAPAIVIPSPSASPSPEPAPIATGGATVVTVETPEARVAEAEVVEAPVVEAPSITVVATTPSAQTEAQIVATAARTGNWDAAYEWCKNHGWTSEQTGEWIARLEDKLTHYLAQLAERAPQTSGFDLEGLQSGSKKDRSLDSPDHRD